MSLTKEYQKVRYSRKTHARWFITLKWTVSRDNKLYFFNERCWFSQFLTDNLWRQYEIKLLHASMTSLTNFENPSSNPLHRSCSCFPGAACCFNKSFRKPPMNVHWRNSTNESEGQPGQIFDAAYRTIFRISKQIVFFSILNRHQLERSINLFYIWWPMLSFSDTGDSG